MKVLYVEDDPTTREYIKKGLERHGCAVDAVGQAAEGLEQALTGVYDLLILDVMLPDRDGFGLLRELRGTGLTTPALFLTARGEVGDRIRGLDLGADDYLAKPFAFAELLARIRVIGRRRGEEPAGEILRASDLSLDLGRRTVEREGQHIELTPRQFALLEYLLRHQGQVVSRSMILEKVWGYGFETSSNVIDVHMNSLRRKVDRDFERRLIHTVRSVGYVLDARGRGEDPDADGPEPL